MSAKKSKTELSTGPELPRCCVLGIYHPSSDEQGEHMSVDAIQYGVQADVRVTKWFKVRCDDSPSGYVEVSKTPPTGANAMTVTIKPLYGEPFTVNADLLRAAVDLALHAHSERFDKVYAREAFRRRRIDGLEVGDRVEVHDRGRADYSRNATVEHVDDYYVHVVVDQHPEEVAEGCPVQRRKLPKYEIQTVYDRESGSSGEERA